MTGANRISLPTLTAGIITALAVAGLVLLFTAKPADAIYCPGNSTQATCACPTSGPGVTCIDPQLYASASSSCYDDPRSCPSTNQRLDCASGQCVCDTPNYPCSGCSAAQTTIGNTCVSGSSTDADPECAENSQYSNQCGGWACPGGTTLCSTPKPGYPGGYCVTDRVCPTGMTWDVCSDTCSTPYVLLSPPPAVSPQSGADIQISGSFSLTSGDVSLGNGDVLMANGKAIAVNGAGATTLNMGNWDGGATGFTVDVYGTVQGDRLAVGSGEQFCIGADCISSWDDILATGADNQTLHYDAGQWVANSSLQTDGTDVAIGTGTFDGRLAVRQDAAADILNLYDGAANIFTVEDGGYVGIGTSDPARRLSVNDTATTVPMSLSGAANGTYIQVISGGTTRGWMGYTSLGSGGMGFLDSTGSTANLLVTNAGNVGIGNDAPAYDLDVGGDINASGQICIDGDCVSTWSDTYPTGTGNGDTLRYNGTTWIANQNLFNDGTNVGIGTATPSATFHVADASTGTPGLQVGDDTTGRIKIGASGWYDDGVYFSPLGRNLYVRGGISNTYLYSSNTYLGNNTGTSNLRVRDNVLFGSDWIMNYNGPNGNTGIGTLTPAYKLDLNGTLRVQGSAWFNGTVVTVNSELYTYDAFRIGDEASDYLQINSDSIIIPNDLDIGDTLYIDSSNRSVGIGSVFNPAYLPQYALDVNGSVYILQGLTVDQTGIGGDLLHVQQNGTDMLTVDWDGNTTVEGLITANGGLRIPTGAGAGLALVSDASGNATWQPLGGIGGGGTPNYVAKFTAASTLGDSSIFDDGSVVEVAAPMGVNGQAADPTYGIRVEGSAMAGWFKDTDNTAEAWLGYGGYGLYTTGALRTQSTFYAYGSSYLGNGAGDQLLVRAGRTLYQGTHLFGDYDTTDISMAFDAPNGRLGIGTSTPGYRLDVQSDNSTSLPIVNIKDNGTMDWTGVRLARDEAQEEKWFIGMDNQEAWDFLRIRGNSANTVISASPDGYVGIGTNLPPAWDTAFFSYFPPDWISDMALALGGYLVTDFWAGTTGNTILGYDAAGAGNMRTAGITPMYNTIIGYNAGEDLGSGWNNTLIGVDAGRDLTSSSDNIMIGTGSGRTCTGAACEANIMIGMSAGRFTTGGSNNILIGEDVQAPTATTSWYLNIGNAIFSTMNNGRVGIGAGKQSPAYALDVNGTVNAGGFRMTTGAAAGYVLTSDAAGSASWQAPSIPDVYVDNAGDTMTGALDMGTNDLNNVRFLTLSNQEQPASGAGKIYFDENFYSDFAEFSVNGGGIAVYDQDGWGAVYTTANDQWATPNFEGLNVSGAISTASFQMTTGASAGSVLISDASGNASWGTLSAITGGGTADRLAKFTAGSTLGDSIVSDDGTTATVSGSMAVTGQMGVGGLAPDLAYGISAQGDTAGGYFSDTGSSIYARLGYSTYGLYTTGHIYVGNNSYLGNASGDFVRLLAGTTRISGSHSFVSDTTPYPEILTIDETNSRVSVIRSGALTTTIHPNSMLTVSDRTKDAYIQMAAPAANSTSLLFGIIDGQVNDGTIRYNETSGMEFLTDRSGGDQVSMTIEPDHDVNFNANTLFVDASANSVGIGDSTPLYPLDVAGSGRFTGTLYANSSLYVNSLANISGDLNAGSGVLFVDQSLGRVGLNDTSPSYSLDVAGTGRFTSTLYASNRVEFTYTGDASGTAGTGVLEIGNSLRLDGNEIITNTGTPLYINNDNGGDVRFDVDTLAVDATNDRVGINTTSPTADLQVIGDGAFSGNLFGNYVYGNNGSMSQNWTVNGDTYSGGRLTVSVPSDTPVYVNRRINDGYLIYLQQDSTYVGGIYVSGSTVTYYTFTGSHPAWTDQDIEKGWLVSMTGENRLMTEGGTEPIYGVKTTTVENDNKVLGSYLAKPSGEDIDRDMHNVMAVGNGFVWVVDEGRDIEVGDFLISSSTAGHARLDSGEYPVSHIVAMASEDVAWSAVTDRAPDGKKHKLISVTYERFDKPNFTWQIDLDGQLEEMDARVSALEKENEELRERVDVIEGRVEQLEWQLLGR